MTAFGSITFEPNVGSQGSPDWSHNLVGGAGSGKELRFYDSDAAGLAIGSLAWPFITQPASAQAIPYAYAYTTDTTGYGVLGNGGNPAAFTISNYLQYRWHWDAVGTFAAAPLTTCYHSSLRTDLSRGDGTIPGGAVPDTGAATARSYLKGAAWGAVGTPSGAPSGAPTATDGSTGAVTAGPGAAWSAWQGLMGNIDWIVAGFTPAGAAANWWNVMLEMFLGPTITPGELVPILSLKFTFT